MSEPVANEVWTLTNKVGIGQGVGMMLPGLKVTVREVVDHGTQGVGDHDGDQVVVVAFFEKGLTTDEEGNTVVGDIPRAVSVGLSDFMDKFTPEGA